MARITFKSKNDGKSGDRGTSFSSYEPCTYAVLEDGVEVAEIVQMHNYPLSKINPVWSGNAVAWASFGKFEAADQTLSKLKTKIKTMTVVA